MDAEREAMRTRTVSYCQAAILAIGLLTSGLVGVYVPGCGGGGGTDDTGSGDPGGGAGSGDLRVAAVTTFSTEVCAAAANRSGEAVAALGQKDSHGTVSTVTGGCFASSTGAGIVCWFGADGMPSVAVSGSAVVRFTSYALGWDRVGYEVRYVGGAQTGGAGNVVPTPEARDAMIQLATRAPSREARKDGRQVSWRRVHADLTHARLGLQVAGCLAQAVLAKGSPTNAGAAACCGSPLLASLAGIEETELTSGHSTTVTTAICTASDWRPCAGVAQDLDSVIRGARATALTAGIGWLPDPGSGFDPGPGGGTGGTTVHDLSGSWTGTATETRGGETVSGTICMALSQSGAALLGTYVTWSDQLSTGSAGTLVGALSGNGGTTTLVRATVEETDACKRGSWSFTASDSLITGTYTTQGDCFPPATGSISMSRGACSLR
jgi:hypothetical protein